jgi:hypothetical protein
MNNSELGEENRSPQSNSHCGKSNVVDMTACSNLFPMSQHHSHSGAFETLEVHEMPQNIINNHHCSQNTTCQGSVSGPETNDISHFNGTHDKLHPVTVVNIANNNSHIDIDSRSAQTLITLVHEHGLENDPHSPLQVDKKVKMVIHKWGPVAPINPQRFFIKMLLSRGYSSSMIPAITSQHRR